MTGTPGNQFIDSLPPQGRSQLFAQLKSVPLRHGHRVQEQDARIEHVYFPLNGIISILAPMNDGRIVEAAMIGKDGGVGLMAGFGQQVATSLALVQAAGTALRIPAGSFQKIVKQNAGLMASIAAHQELLLLQIQQTAACNGLHDATQRMARWLLRAHDLIDGGQHIPLTQEFLANMLGVYRTTVTLVAGSLQDTGSIRYRRGRIELLNVASLEKQACECHGVMVKLSKRLKART